MGSVTEIEMYKMHLKGRSYRDIAKIKKTSIATVSRNIAAVTKSDEYQLGAFSVVTFLEWFEKASHFFMLQNSEYQELIEEVEKLKINDKLDDIQKINLTIKKVEAIRRLKESQDRNMERIVFEAKQGKIVLAVQLMRDMLTNMPKKNKQFKLVQESEDEESE